MKKNLVPLLDMFPQETNVSPCGLNYNRKLLNFLKVSLATSMAFFQMHFTRWYKFCLIIK